MRRLAVLLTLVPYVAASGEMPCRADGDRVSCARDGFDTLVKSCVDAKADAKACGIRLAATEERVVETDQALAQCLTRPVPQPIAPPKAWTRVMPVVLGVVGAAVLTASITSDWSVGGRAAGAIVGSALVGTGVVFALP